MGETAGQSVRTLARLVALGVPLLLGMAALAGACAETKAPVGAACMKSEDCLSGICSQLLCAAPSPTTSSMLNNPDASTSAETGGAEASSEAAAEAAAETSTPSDGGDGGTAEAAGD
ncbi:MAG TPA: hypothetical protein VIF09_14350 [Polyangiaceae bacterium]|jgi:hypothetical protein